MKKLIFGLLLTVTLALIPYKSMSSVKDDPGSVTLTEQNTLILNSEVGGESVSAVISKAKELDTAMTGIGFKESATGKKPLYLFLNTPGGSIQAGLELIEALKGIGRPVNTVTLFAASMGFQIAQNMDTRYIIKNGVLMSHRAMGGFEGQFGGEGLSQIDNRYALWKSRTEEMDAQTVSRSGGKQTMASYQHQYSNEMWLTGHQSVDQGYADKVVTVKCDISLAGVTTHETLLMGLFKVQYDLDKCPINTSPMNIRVAFSTNKGVMDSNEFIKQGGNFGSGCLIESASKEGKLCALDTTLSMERIKELATQFGGQYERKMRQVVDRF